MGRPSTAASFYEGIDFLRAAAVFLVLWSHGGPLLLEQQRSYLYSTFFRPGFWGVTLFFSISGFLIIGQLFDIAAGSRKESLRVFLARRCLRTMPTYWLVTLLVLLLGLASPPVSPALTANLLFLQSFWQLSSVLPVAWSLVIEVWSYMLYASLALASRAIARRFAQGGGWLEYLPSGASLIGLSLIALPLIAGFIRYDLSLHGASVQSLKQGLWPQLDALAYGGLLAWFQRARPESFQRLSSRRILLPVCLLLMALVGATAPQLFQNVQLSLPDGIRAWIAFGFYSSVGLLSSLLIIAFWGFRYRFLPGWFSSACRSLSRCSYSVYLIHLYVVGFVVPIGLGVPAFVCYLVLSIVIGGGSWLVLEKPFARLRYTFS